LIISNKLSFLRAPCLSLLFIFSLVAVLCLSTGASPVSDQKNLPKTIKIVMDNNYPPYVFLDGKGNLQGILIDQWRLWEQKTGIRTLVSGMDWDEALNRMEAGEFDVIDTIFFNEQRAQIYDFSKPYTKIDVSIFFHKSISGISGVDSLQGFPIAVKSGDNAIAHLRGKGIGLFQEYPSYEAIVRAAKEQKVMVTVIDNPPALYFFYKMGILDQFRYSAPLYTGEFHRAVMKGNRAILELVEKGFSQISESEYQAIDRKWFGTEARVFYPYLRHIAIGLGGLMFVVLFLFVWNRTLRKKVHERTLRLEEEIVLNIKKTESLQVSEEKYRDLVAQLPETVWEFDEKGTYTFINLCGLHSFGYTTEDLNKGLSIFQTMAPEDCERARENLQKRVRGEQFGSNEYTMVRKDGTRFPALIHTNPITRNNRRVGFRSVVVDITEQRRVEKALRESEERYRSIFENAVLGVFQTSPDGHFIRINAAFAQMHGYVSTDEMISDTTDIAQQRYVNPDDRARLGRLLETNGTTKFEAQYYQKDRSKIWLLMNVRAAPGPDGKMLYYEGTVEDVTDRKITEQAMQETLEKLRKLTGSTIHVISRMVEAKAPFTSGHQKRVADLARTIAREMGFSHRQIEGIRVAGSLHDLGMIGVPGEILSSPRTLTDYEFALVKTHPVVGYDILKDVEFPWPVADIIVQHHERMDGSGYPYGVQGEAILPEAYILAVADVVEAVASHRPYRPAMSINAALEIIDSGRGTLYDPAAVDTCVRLFREKGYQLKES